MSAGIYIRTGFNLTLSQVIPIPVGVNEIIVTGLGLPFIPIAASITVRPPAGQPLILGGVTGEYTSDGFTYNFTGTTGVSGYVLDAIFFS